MGRKRPKALLAEQGIVHLKHSFVQPTEESGLLKTVGGGEDRSAALILSTGSYGYAIPISTLTKEQDETDAISDDDIEILDNINDSDIKIVRQAAPNNPSTSKSKGSSSMKCSTNECGTGSKKEIDPNGLSIAELVRVIGGGSGAPLRKCDVVDDRHKEKVNEEETTDANVDEEMEDDPEAEAFYESLGMQSRKRRKLNDPEPITVIRDDSNSNSAVNNDEDVLQSIAEYYKSGTEYYYTQQPDPYGVQRLEFGPLIDTEDLSEYDQDYIQLAKLAQRARAAAEVAMRRRMLEKEKEDSVHKEAIYDPLPMELVTTTKPEELGITVDTTLTQYWEFVKEDPHNFDRWIYLVQYVENSGNLNSCRSVFSAFLPLFPYCFGYWKRYSELEKKSYCFGRALAILEKGLEFIPLSCDLWLSYVALYREINAHLPDFESNVRKQYDRALNSCGMEFRSDQLWESFIDWETENKRLKKAFNLYRRLIQVPTRLYNRHWDNVQLLVRDHHPRDFLEYDEYELMRKKGCKKLKFRYKAEPEVEPGEIRKTSKPEDKLMDYTKSKILKQIVNLHSKCEEEVNKRWVFEDKIKRPYFHTKPLDKFQLRNWEEYLNFEISDGNYDRIILLFERCLIACAQYEEFWSKYARYVENYHKANSKDMNVSIHVQKLKINEELVSQQETEKEEAVIADVKELLDGMINKLVELEDESNAVEETIESLLEKVDFLHNNENFVFNICSTAQIKQFYNNVKVGSDSICNEMEIDKETPVACRQPDLRGNLQLPHKSGCSTDSNIHSEPSEGEVTSLISVPTFPETCFRWQETVRDIFKRACIIHCAKKPVIRLQWSAYEEELGNVDESRQLIQHVLHWFPTFLDAKLQLLDLERRCENVVALEELYGKYIAIAKSPSESSLLSNKFARFLFKELGKADKALTVMRKAIKKDKGNASLYSYVFDICYERYPSDRKGAAAALELAILSKDLSEEQKLIFLRRKMLFFQEHGDIKRVRDAVDQLRMADEINRKIKAEEQRKRDEEEREIALLSSAALKQVQNVQLEAYPVPELSKLDGSTETQKPVPIEFDDKEANTNSPSGPIRAQIISEGTSVSEVITITEGPELPYQKVAPPLHLGVDSSTYGYGSKHPDMKIMETMAQKEYEKLESKGYSEDKKDTEDDKKYLRQQAKLKHSTKDPTYIIPPRESYSVVTIGGPPKRNMDPPNPGELELKPPRVMAILPVPSTTPCVNIPEAFIKDGGELCISESRLGFSILRYWPNFLNEDKTERMFRAVRRHVKWHQKQKIIAGHWRYLHRLVSWLGPCDFTHNGMVLNKCEDWPPEILDQLHRINNLVSHEFNACSLDLYRHGHDWNSWHSDNLPAYGSNPPVALVTFGAVRVLEMKRKGPEFNYVRFPLKPGSLVLMEGVTQADWAHQLTKDPSVKDETLVLSFRIMHAIETPNTNKLIKFVRGNENGKSTTEEKQANMKDATVVTTNNTTTAAVGKVNQANGVAKNVESPLVTEKETDKTNSTKIIFHKVR